VTPQEAEEREGSPAGPRAAPDSAPGVLRVLTLFHEAEALGAGISFLRVTEELAEYGWTASGWLPGPGPLHDMASRQLGLALQGDRPFAFSVRGWRERPGVVARARRTPGYLRDVRSALMRVRPHVVHANTLLSLPEAAVARSCGLPVVLQSHELPPAGAKTTGTIRYAARIADVLVGVSDAVSDMLRRHAGRTPVLTVRNGVAEAEDRLPRRDGPLVIGCVGTVSRTKGTDVFVRAAQLALEERPEMRFEHVGSHDLHRDEGLDDELARLRAEIRPQAALAMEGPRPASEVLPGWDVFVSPSLSEAFPLAVLEAMAAGLPVVATGVGGVPEQIDHLETGVLVRPNDPEALATWLVRLHDDAGLRDRLGQAAARRARVEFTLERQAEGLHRAYLTALNLQFGPPRIRRAARST
jgi:glycosyltransferase involved in cell wall biosynthesis